ncbi:MAG TPA: ATP phosphoribosyltransferase [Spirochaetia bacterium]|nr:ATP phosphoribosyltransferase [Spirochaetales bacterium]HRS66091.1 ATP phosphoribosyltransferase [Spirochaetia bacterium]HOT59881.1 ATP phosphoribosyltransferase [Spirochaetales bacterium]HPD79878.1 ATP phosphoribosyltransferase [Spirochaetales bacterium]HQK33267.1 ATP phosphoribosyltransferase [Spirochaetales bacterium]
MEKLRLLIPKGRILNSILELFRDSGIVLRATERGYRPLSSLQWLDVKIMKPQNIGELLELGSHDAGFTGYDWLQETHADVETVMDLGLDPVSIVSAIPEKFEPATLVQKELVVATEYINIAKAWLDTKGYRYRLLRTYGATEVFPPDDADMVIDNSSTGETLRENGLKVVDTILTSSTYFVSSKQAMENPDKRMYIDQLAMLFTAVLDARERVMLEMNISKAALSSLAGKLPCMRSPTIAPLYEQSGYAVKIAVKRNEVPQLIPLLKTMGATDIVEYELRKVIL